MSPQDDGWIDEDVGPVSRPYTVTGGRTRSHGDLHFDLIDIVVATGAQPRRAFSLAPEHLRILGLSQRPMAVAELAAAIGLPLGVVRVLLGDLLYEELVTVSKQTQRVTDRGLLQKVLNGLQAL
jgi:DNA-binding transcriptional ArsR family regulator